MTGRSGGETPNPTPQSTRNPTHHIGPAPRGKRNRVFLDGRPPPDPCNNHPEKRIPKNEAAPGGFRGRRSWPGSGYFSLPIRSSITVFICLETKSVFANSESSLW